MCLGRELLGRVSRLESRPGSPRPRWASLPGALSQRRAHLTKVAVEGVGGPQLGCLSTPRREAKLVWDSGG